MRYLDLAAGSAERHPSDVAVVGSGRRLTFAELHDRTTRLAAALRARGLRPGDRVALLSDNEPEYVEIQAACLRGGFALVPLNVRLADAEIAFILQDCSPSVLIVGRTQSARARLAADAGIRHVLTLGARSLPGRLGSPKSVEGYDEALAGAEPAPLDDPDDLGLTAVILYTSGTTGRPKGAMIDRAAFTARVLINCAELRVRRSDVHLAALPMFHIAAFLAYAHTVAGGRVVMLPDFSPQRCLETMVAERVTTTVLVPTMIGMLLDSPALEASPPRDLWLIVYGGSSIAPRVLGRALSAFGCRMLQQYGMTESGASSMLRPDDHDPADLERLSSAGTAALGFEVRVVDDTGVPVPAGVTGEIVCRGPSVMSGYWNRPEASAAALADGWMHTGDVGHRDARGYLHITDRRNDMIITGGENVYPREVEAVLLDHREVGDVAVLGLPDPRWGEVVTAVLVEPAPDDAVLEQWARAHLAGYKVPRRWIRVAELPRNATGKVQKHRLRAELREPETR